MTTSRFDLYRQHTAAIQTWSEYIKTEKSRGTTAREIHAALLRNGLSPEAAEIVLEAHGTGFLREERLRKYWYKPILGALLIAIGCVGVVFSLVHFVYGTFGLSIAAWGIWQFISYRQKLHGN